MATQTRTKTVTKTATKTAAANVNWIWEGIDKNGKKIKGDVLAATDLLARAQLRRQGIVKVNILKKQKVTRGKRITERDIVIFTRQMSTMMKAGVPLLQSFDIAAKGHNNPSMTRMLMDVRADIESGASLGQAFSNRPKYFDKLFCSLVAAGEAGGVLDSLLEKLATYKEKVMKIKSQIKSALIYPVAIIVVAFAVTLILMIKVIPMFAELFASFHAKLPTPTLIVIAISNFLVNWYLIILPVILLAVAGLIYLLKTSAKAQERFDSFLLHIPVIGNLVRKATISRWARTSATLFAAGVPLVEALDSVSGAAGNYIYFLATKRIQTDVSAGSTLTASMQNTGLFPNMVIQMTSIGEESGSLDDMLNKVADFYDDEVDAGVVNMKSLMEPIIMVVLGVLIGGLVLAMYMPIFNIGNAVG